MSASTTLLSDTDSDPGRWRALPVILTGSFLAFLDLFIVTIALPAMRDDLGARPSQLQFVVAGYGIGFSVSLITGGRLGDIFGRRRVFRAGLLGFTVASALCGLAPSADALIAARVLQAVMAAAVVPQVLAIIRTTFPAAERARAIGLYGTSMGLASIVAQLVGGLLVNLNLFGLSWRLIFLINVPIGLIAVSLAGRMIGESRGTNRPTLDLAGVGYASLSLFLLIFPIVEGREAGWPIWSFVMLAAVLPVFAAFMWHERRVIEQQRTPLVALHLFHLPAVAFGLVIAIGFFTGLGVFFVVLTVFFQNGFGCSALAAGLMFLPFALGFSASSAASGVVTAWLGIRIVNLGIGLMAIGLLGIILTASVTLDQRSFVPLFLVYGIGQGLAQPALINVTVGGSGVAEEDAGSVAGVFLTIAQSSIAFGVAAIGDIFFARLGSVPREADYQAALVLALGCCLILQTVTFVLILMFPKDTNHHGPA